MGSQGDGGVGQQSPLQKKARKGSVYGLTLNEVQNKLEEPLHSMNLDVLLRNMLPMEEDRSSVIDLENRYPHLSSSSGTPPEGQGSSDLSGKTVDEVWKDIQQAECKSGGNAEGLAPNKTQPTPVKMTLEDFLVKAGVVSGGSEQHSIVTSIAGPVGNHRMDLERSPPQGMHWLHQYHQIPTCQPQHQQQAAQESVINAAYAPCRPGLRPPMVGVGREMESGIQEAQIILSSPFMGNFPGAQAPGREGVPLGERPEKAMERRRKRMIKNRESAARSRARKQAYTNELEIKISRLEEENDMLKKHKESEKILHDVPMLMSKSHRNLRRTNSNPF